MPNYAGTCGTLSSLGMEGSLLIYSVVTPTNWFRKSSSAGVQITQKLPMSCCTLVAQTCIDVRPPSRYFRACYVADGAKVLLNRRDEVACRMIASSFCYIYLRRKPAEGRPLGPPPPLPGRIGRISAKGCCAFQQSYH